MRVSSANRTEVVRGVTGQQRQIFSEAGTGLGPAKPPDKVQCCCAVLARQSHSCDR